MKRRVFLAALVAVAAGASPALARDRSNDIVRQLKKNGYRIVDVGRTFLGRVRILATRAGGQREIILNPATGEILRDLWIAGGNGGSGGGDWDDWDDHDDQDDDDDDDDDDDREDDTEEDREEDKEDDKEEHNSGKGSNDDD